MWALGLTIFFGGAFAMVLGIGRALGPPEEGRNYFVPIFLLTFGALQLNSCLEFYFWWIYEPLLLNLSMSLGLLFFTGMAPLLYYSFDLLGGGEYRNSRGLLLHALPTLTTAAALVIAFTADFDFLARDFHWNKQFRGIDLIGYFTSGIVFAYIIALCVRLLRLRRLVMDEARARVNFLLLMSVGFMLCVIVDFVNDEGFAGAAATVILVVLFLAENRHPGSLRRLAMQDRGTRYGQSRVNNLDMETVLAQLRRIMTEEELFLDEELSLPDLAERLDLGTHQLSEILNVGHGGGFYGFVNEYRVERARRLLREEPDLPILTVGFRSGFNTSSAFYNSFKRLTGKTPGNFRKEERPVSRGA